MYADNTDIQPLVSIILPVRNAEDYLLDCVNSVFCQSYKNWELIIIVNCSVDRSYVIAKELELKDNRLRVIQSSIGQLNYNLNLGIDVAQGDIIARLDADDRCFPHRLEVQVPLLRDYDVVGSNVTMVSKKREVISITKFPTNNKSIRSMIFFKTVLAHPTIVFRKNILISAGGYQGGQYCEDYELWLRLMRSKDIKFYNVEEPLLYYLRHDNQMSSSKLSYAYVSSYLWREAIIYKSFTYFVGCLIYLMKYWIR